MPPRLIRRRPLLERMKAYLNPLDFLLWLSEELNSNDWEQWQKDMATPIGLALNVIMLIARANCGPSSRRKGDDIFGDEEGSPGWLAWFSAFLVHFLTLLSIMNALYTFWRSRHYRLFENSLDDPPSTPSAHRVRVDSSPLSSSPLRFLSNVLAGDSAESRSHPDATRDVWELAVWDPTPLCLRTFCFFSPGHALVYLIFLPTPLQDPRPSTTVITTMLLTGLLTAQLLVLQSFFSQQSKDASVIHKEVLNEYDTKYVHPRTRPQMRDVGTQFSSREMSADDSTPNDESRESVDTYVPTVLINRGFHTRPNPNYIKHIDPEGLTLHSSPSRLTPSNIGSSMKTAAHLRDASSPLHPTSAIRQPHLPNHRRTGTRDGGSLGVYSHAESPLRKAASTNFADLHREHERSMSPVKQEGSPLKRVSLAARHGGQRWGHLQGTATARRESERF